MIVILPMRKHSTLIYFVNNFQTDLNNYENEVYSNCDQKNLTEKAPKGVGPSERAIRNILDFAHAYEVITTQSAGCTDLILN